MNKTVFIDGQQTIVNANNWRTLAKLKLSETLAANPNATNAEQLGIYRSFQELGGGGDAFTQTNAEGAARFNDFGASAVINNPFVRAADAAEGAEKSVIGQGGVDALHEISNTVVGDVKASVNFITSTLPEKLKNAGSGLGDWLGKLTTTIKFVAVAVAASAALLIVYKVKK